MDRSSSDVTGGVAAMRNPHRRSEVARQNRIHRREIAGSGEPDDEDATLFGRWPGTRKAPSDRI
ncbi:MAG: hypothetical protein C4547_11165 [Phycisphaerales bacterium]|nr:MAG: hypothetical protein C4547_11165 [Phycisphaerales bacterium]